MLGKISNKVEFEDIYKAITQLIEKNEEPDQKEEKTQFKKSLTTNTEIKNLDSLNDKSDTEDLSYISSKLP